MKVPAGAFFGITPSFEKQKHLNITILEIDYTHKKRGKKMAIVEPNEVVVLILVLVGYPFVILNYSRYKSTLYLFLGYTALVVGSILTIIEGFYYKEIRDIINFFEHLIGILLAGFFFSLSAYFTMKKSSTIEYDIERKLRGKSKK